MIQGSTLRKINISPPMINIWQMQVDMPTNSPLISQLLFNESYNISGIRSFYIFPYLGFPGTNRIDTLPHYTSDFGSLHISIQQKTKLNLFLNQNIGIG